MIIPEKLKKGDELRIIAPSRSGGILSEEGVEYAKAQLEQLGFVVSFGEHLFDMDLHNSSSIQQRLDDLHEAFRNPQVKGILTAIGGFNSNELLPYIDYEFITNHPKVFCGYSDITAIGTAIATQAGFVTYSGLHFSSFSMEKENEYQMECFLDCVTKVGPLDLRPSAEWSDDAWYLDQENRNFTKTSWKTYNAGTARGQLWGGNLCTLNLLQGTPYMPDLEGAVLFLEDDGMSIPETFARDLASLMQNTSSIAGLVLGRFQRESNITEEQLHFILGKHPMLKEIPVLYDVDFGHTQPTFTFPIGGEVEVDAEKKTVRVWQH